MELLACNSKNKLSHDILQVRLQFKLGNKTYITEKQVSAESMNNSQRTGSVGLKSYYYNQLINDELLNIRG